MALVKMINYPPHRVNYDDLSRAGQVGYGAGNGGSAPPGYAIQNGLADQNNDFLGTANDDASHGWSPLSMVVNQANGNVYVCVNASIGAAVWMYFGGF